jgi:hypothetical protein
MIRLSFGLESSSGSPDISVRMGKDVTAESSELEALQPAFPKFGRVYTITQFLPSDSRTLIINLQNHHPAVLD